MTTGLPGITHEAITPAPPADLATGVCILIGTAAQGPTYEPTPLHRADAFAPTFGLSTDGFLGAAVDGFFANGGVACHVVRADLADTDWFERSWAAVAAMEDADLVAVPDLALVPPERRSELQAEILDRCASRGDRFAILDAPHDSVAAAQTARARLSSRFGAMYHPWITRADGRAVPPSGHVAGVYAASDASGGVAAAPANKVLQGALDLSPAPGRDDAALLYADGVNPLRALPGRGLRVWGARTLAGASEPEWTSVGVSRLFITVTRWLTQIGAAFVFIPNDLALWVRVRRELSGRLWQLWRQGGLAGATPDAAFYVKCDAETNPPEVRDAGLMVTEIGLAPTAAAEFIVVRLVQQNGQTAAA
jgi:phage tail sheath protein FI